VDEALSISYELVALITLEINDQVKWDKCSAYCQIIHVAEYGIKQFYDDHGDLAATKKLVERIITMGEGSSEMLQEPDYWEMGVDRIRRWRDDLESKS
jgi:hypothetical protein